MFTSTLEAANLIPEPEFPHDLMVLRGLLPSLPMNQTVYPNLVILVLFSIALGLSGGPLQLQMGDASLQGGNMVGQISKTYHLMI